jgi:hypothetical protein
VATRVASKAIDVVNGVGKFEDIAEIAKDFEIKIEEKADEFRHRRFG